MSIKKCKTCSVLGAFSDGSPGCGKFQIKVNPEEDYCSWHTTIANIMNCSLCGKQVQAKELYYWISQDESRTYQICEQCLNIIGTCATCKYGNICNFRNDHSEPQVIMKTVQQGFMTMQTQVKNPKLIVKHCQKCHCSDGADPSIRDIICFKDEDNMCAKWEMR